LGKSLTCLTHIAMANIYKFGNNKDGIWPKRDSNSAKTVIPYCYANKAAMDALEDYVTKGAAVWNRGLGGEPGPGSGHSLDFSLHLVPSKDWYCYRDSGEYTNVRTAFETYTDFLRPS
jgi:hypothetical protein